MAVPCKKVEGAEYKDRTGRVVPYDDASVFKRRHGAFLICFVGDYMLLSRSEHSGGDWELPGGGIDEGEAPEVAVLREVLEETNVDFGEVSIEKQHSQRTFYHALDNGEFWNYDQDYYLLNDSSLTQHIFDGVIKSTDNCDAKWILKSDLEQTPIRHDHRLALMALGYKSTDASDAA